eukprot:3240632-Alexandrium_andersonii.AAC.1
MGCALTPDLLQHAADLIRGLLQGSHLVQDDARFTVGALQAVRDEMVLNHSRLSSKAYAIRFLIQCLLLSGLLKSEHMFRRALGHALDIVVPDASLRKYYEDLLAEDHIPSHSTLNRHRLTVTMGYCRSESLR